MRNVSYINNTCLCYVNNVFNDNTNIGCVENITEIIHVLVWTILHSYEYSFVHEYTNVIKKPVQVSSVLR